MDVVLTPEQDRLVSEAVASGRFRHREDVVREALALWENQERQRLAFRASLDEAEASARDANAGAVTDMAMADLAEAVKRRGRERLAVEARRRG